MIPNSMVSYMYPERILTTENLMGRLNGFRVAYRFTEKWWGPENPDAQVAPKKENRSTRRSKKKEISNV